MAKRKYYRKTYKKPVGVRLFFLFFKLLFLGVALFILGTTFIFIYYAKDFPRPEIFTERQLAQSTKIYDRTGKVLLYEIYGEEKRTWIPLETIPDHIKKAVIALFNSE